MELTMNNIAISGNIGVGKTTLGHLLKGRRGYEMITEDMDNPFLELYYQDMEKWALQLQLWFLTQRYESHKAMGGKIFTQDRSHMEEFSIFIETMRDMRILCHRDYQLYKRVYDIITSHIPDPALIIYMKADMGTLVERIQQRGRDYEMDISIKYLSDIQSRYDKWIEGVKREGKIQVFEVDTDEVNIGDESFLNELDGIFDKIKFK